MRRILLVDDHHEVRRGVQPSRSERGGEDPPMAVGLHRGTRLGRRHEHGAGQITGQRVGYLAGVGGI